MIIVKVLGVLLLHVALVTPDTQICHDTDKNAYSIITCGAPGKDGLPGINGIDGKNGEKGEPGLPGPPGKTGEIGPIGEHGPPGLQGGRGDTGASGPPGERGIAGPTGARGDEGANGATGPPGPKGDRGDSAAPALEDLKKRIVDLERRLLSSLEQQRKAFAFFKGGARSGDRIYISKGDIVTYREAISICSNAGGQPATPYNLSENNAILQICNQYGTNAVLGINDLQKEGDFRYLSGVAISYTNWNSGEPNNYQGKNEDCVGMHRNGKWNDYTCETKLLAICEF